MENTAIKLAHANASEMATQMQSLYSNADVQIVPVEEANIILVTGSKSEIRDTHRSIPQLDQVAGEFSADEIADATQYIRKLADSRNTAFRITRPHKPRIRPLPPISIIGDPGAGLQQNRGRKHGAAPGLREAGRARARSRRANRA